MRTFFIISIFLIAVLTTLTAQNDEIPYIYYHSEVLNAIVIEQADGSDSRMIAQGVMPENHSIVSGPGWSPSGRWFAWTSTYPLEYYQGPSKIWLISADGSRRITLLDEVSHASVASWSPTEDYLYVVDVNSENGNIGNGTPENPGNEAYLVDANNERLVAFFDDILVDSIGGGDPVSPWSENGQWLSFSGSDYHLGENGEAIVGNRFRRTLYIDGRYEDWELASGYGRSPEPEFHIINLPDGISVTLENQTLRIEREGETSLSFDIPSENIGLMEWSPSGDYALFYHWSPCEDGFCPDSLNLLSLPDERLFQLSDTVRRFSTDSLWDSNQDRAVFETADGHVQVLDAHTQTLTTVPLPDDTDFEENISAFWDIKTSGLLRIGARDVENHTYRYYDYDINTGELTQRDSIYDTPFDIADFAPSPDNRYLASYTDASITDQMTGEIIHMHPFSGMARSGVCVINWHPSSEWLFFSMGMTWAGGQGGYCGGNVVSVDGRIQREIGACNLYNNCAGWLPEHVLPYLAPGQDYSVVPEPSLTIEHEGRVLGVGWSNGGGLLATYEEINREFRLNIWNIDGEVVELMHHYEVDECYQWLMWDCQLIWNPSNSQIALANISSTQIIDVLTGEIVMQTEQYFANWINDDEYTLTDNVSTFNLSQNLLARAIQGDIPSIEIVDQATGQIRATFIPEDSDLRWVDAIAFVPNSQALAIFFNGSSDAFLWDYASDTFTIFDSNGAIDILAIEDRGLLAGYGIFSPASFWSAEGGRVVTRLNRYVAAISFNPDGSRFVTASSTVAEIWDFDAVVP